MAASPEWKVYGPNGSKDYRAACKHIEDAACLVAFLGEGSTIRHGHNLIVWREGGEGQSAAESYDTVALIAYQRRDSDRLPDCYGIGCPHCESGSHAPL